MSNNEIILYQTDDGETKLEVNIDGDTVWLTQVQMAELFQTTRQNISLHIGNVYDEGELEKNRTIKESFIVRQEGKRQVRRKVDFYNLDVIISVGYRVKSKRGTQFRIWATQRLRDLLTDGLIVIENELFKGNSESVQAYQIAVAVAKMARQQIILQAQVDNHESRLVYLEEEMSKPDHNVSRSQAMELSQAVKAVALALGKRSGGNEFGGVYGELYRSFEITSYKEMPASRFDEAMKFLTEWHQSLVSDVPF